MDKIILASNNIHKINEFKQMFYDAEILTLNDIEFYDEIIEDGKSFEENCLIKAKTIKNFVDGKINYTSIIADDSGLCVEALNGEPGINSARYSGDHNFAKNREKLLEALNGVTNRNAYFNCTLVELFPNGKYNVAEGITYGEITKKEYGDTSFGYDCLFYCNELGKTFGLADEHEKNAVSHRAKAIQKLISLRLLRK